MSGHLPVNYSNPNPSTFATPLDAMITTQDEVTGSDSDSTTAIKLFLALLTSLIKVVCDIDSRLKATLIIALAVIIYDVLKPCLWRWVDELREKDTKHSRAINGQLQLEAVAPTDPAATDADADADADEPGSQHERPAELVPGITGSEVWREPCAEIFEHLIEEVQQVSEEVNPPENKLNTRLRRFPKSLRTVKCKRSIKNNKTKGFEFFAEIKNTFERDLARAEHDLQRFPTGKKHENFRQDFVVPCRERLNRLATAKNRFAVLTASI